MRCFCSCCFSHRQTSQLHHNLNDHNLNDLSTRNTDQPYYCPSHVPHNNQHAMVTELDTFRVPAALSTCHFVVHKRTCRVATLTSCRGQSCRSATCPASQRVCAVGRRNTRSNRCTSTRTRFQVYARGRGTKADDSQEHDDIGTQACEQYSPQHALKSTAHLPTYTQSALLCNYARIRPLTKHDDDLANHDGCRARHLFRRREAPTPVNTDASINIKHSTVVKPTTPAVMRIKLGMGAMAKHMPGQKGGWTA